jgi:formylglycine-generating enzyme required for sulfatase activity
MGERDRQMKVTLMDGFWMSKMPVTQGQWETVTGGKPSHFKGASNLPVESVSWKDCQEFLRRLNGKIEGCEFRLPSEAQWEYACRAGSDANYCFGDDEAGLQEYAWFGEPFETGKTRPVGQKKANAWGLHDMHGNVWEWCEDDWHYEHEGAPADGSAWVDDPRGERRVLRGGGWFFPAFSSRCASRIGGSPGSRYRGYGVRLVCGVVE